jgi:DNA excision repair protein ERCC-2
MNDIPNENTLSPGIWTLADVLQHGRDNGTCPYFTIRRLVCPHVPFLVIGGLIRVSRTKMPFVDVIIYSYHYLLDPKVAEQVSKEMSKDSIVVFDEAHNIGGQ